jgi:hypothetical protein
MQILHYEHGQKYEPHFDFFHDKVNQEMGGHRVATVLMYLSDVGKGGETVFPNSEVNNCLSSGPLFFFCFFFLLLLFFLICRGKFMEGFYLVKHTALVYVFVCVNMIFLPSHPHFFLLP